MDTHIWAQRSRAHIHTDAHILHTNICIYIRMCIYTGRHYLLTARALSPWLSTDDLLPLVMLDLRDAGTEPLCTIVCIAVRLLVANV